MLELRLPDHLTRGLVVPHAEQPWVPQLIMPRPLQKRDLNDDLRPYPVRAHAWQAFAFRERRVGDLERVETFAELEQEFRVEAGSDFARENEVIILEVADQQ